MRKPIRITRATIRHGARTACAAGLAIALAAGSVPSAFAATASSELDRLAARVESATATYRDASSKAADLQAQIDAMADEILALEQETLPAQREAAARAASNLYKLRSGSANLVSMLLGAESFGDFITLTKYLSTIEQGSIDELERLNDMRAEMESRLQALSQAKDEAVAQQRTATEALAQARSAHGEMAERVAAAGASDSDRAKADAAKDAIDQAVDESGSQAEPSRPSGGETPTEPEGGQSPTQPQPGGDGGSGGADQGESEQDGGWLSGVASYYGIGDGFMGGTTASGEIVTETSMGIAMLNVPFGTRVEIRYGGRSVIAYVNDRGPYVHGRVIDMQPAVARALGFINVGVGTVQYRFL